MALLLLEDIRRLLEQHQPPCVSIMFPTIKAGADIRQNQIRFKNFFRKAHDAIASGFKENPDAFLDRARHLLHDYDFWQDQSDSFAMFISGDTCEHYRLPFHVDQALKVNNRFHISPLLPMFFENGRFYILAVSQNDVRLFQVALDNIRQVDLIDTPKNIDEILAQYTGEKHVEWHTQLPGNIGHSKWGLRQAYFHGQGGGSLHSDDKIQQFFYLVNKGVHQTIRQERVPLVFAGVDYLYPIWKSVNSYSNLCSRSIEGNPDRLSGKDLLDRARDIVAPRFQQAKLEAIDKYMQFSGSGHTSSDPNAIADYALQGRIDILFAATAARFPTPPGEQSKNAFAINDDLIDNAVGETFLNRGRVFKLPKDEMPDHADICATLRY